MKINDMAIFNPFPVFAKWYAPMGAKRGLSEWPDGLNSNLY